MNKNKEPNGEKADVKIDDCEVRQARRGQMMDKNCHVSQKN